MTNEVIIGIDLGTTFSAVAYIDKHGKPQIIENREGGRTTPSVIFFEEDGSAIVGEFARNQAIVAPRRTVRFIKTEMGNPSFRLNIDGKEYLPEVLSAHILKKLKNDAEAHLGTQVTRAVVSVPAYFKDAQRGATSKAAEMAGLEVVRIINEPTAAALAYGFAKVVGRQTILVYDLGGGTFDVTVMRVEGKVFTILATDGDARLGGKNIDARIVDFLAEEFQREHGTDLRTDPFSSQDLWNKAEIAKKDLSFRTNVAVVLSLGEKVLRVDLSRDRLFELIQDLVLQTKQCLARVLEATKLTWKEIDIVLLAGGSSRIPAVRDMIRQVSGKDAAKDLNPDECVALGAAIQTLVLAEDGINPDPGSPTTQGSDVLVQDVASHSLGVKALASDQGGYINSIIIPRFTPLPCERKKAFATSEDDQRKVEIEVLQGEDVDPRSPNVDLIGKVTVSDLPPGKAGSVRIEVLLRYNASGAIEVVATEMVSGRAVRETVMKKANELSADIVAEKKLDLESVNV